MEATLLARTMIVHFHAMLKAPLNDAARAVVLQLLAQAEAELARRARRTAACRHVGARALTPREL
jgi:hypothetical protein